MSALIVGRMTGAAFLRSRSNMPRAINACLRFIFQPLIDAACAATSKASAIDSSVTFKEASL